MTLWTVDRQHMPSTAAVFMTTTLLKGCNVSHSASYMAVSWALSLHFSCCCPFWAGLLTLNFIFGCTIWAFPSWHNRTISQIQAATRWEKSLLRDPGPELRLGGRKEGTVKTINRTEKQNTPHPFRSPFERTAKSILWPIRQWGGEANCNF